MKKLIFILVVTLVMISCGNVNHSIDSSKYENYELELNCGKLVYSDSILTYTDYCHTNTSLNYDYENYSDTVVNRIENIIYKDIEVHCDNLGGTGKIGSFYIRIFYHWKTKDVYMVVHNFTGIPELNKDFVFFNWYWTLDEVEDYYTNHVPLKNKQKLYD